uniref:Uncharacterized protein n=1 Tax=Ixodes ricinus TaxID=34613 RepID=A0A0K8RET6_IXORI
MTGLCGPHRTGPEGSSSRLLVPVHQSGAPRVRGSRRPVPRRLVPDPAPDIAVRHLLGGRGCRKDTSTACQTSTTWNYGTTMAQFRRPS